MEKYLDFLSRNELFSKIEKKDILSMLQCLGAKKNA